MEVVDGVRRLFAAFNKHDWGAFSAELDPEVEYTPVEENATRHGREAVTEYAKGWLEAGTASCATAGSIASATTRTARKPS